jgi:hypothetical protein
MTLYEIFKNDEQICTHLAQTTTDNALRTFYAKAAEGYKIKLENLTLREACL